MLARLLQATLAADSSRNRRALDLDAHPKSTDAQICRAENSIDMPQLCTDAAPLSRTLLVDELCRRLRLPFRCEAKERPDNHVGKSAAGVSNIAREAPVRLEGRQQSTARICSAWLPQLVCLTKRPLPRAYSRAPQQRKGARWRAFPAVATAGAVERGKRLGQKCGPSRIGAGDAVIRPLCHAVRSESIVQAQSANPLPGWTSVKRMRVRWAHN
mmetsp:Transcript_35084/g.96933  ORF Transcript_35084/g.96933 Transcript_35084/m.96933 type:complete len:214 (-) Transcript_35084:2507-3148(-)